MHRGLPKSGSNNVLIPFSAPALGGAGVARNLGTTVTQRLGGGLSGTLASKLLLDQVSLTDWADQPNAGVWQFQMVDSADYWEDIYRVRSEWITTIDPGLIHLFVRSIPVTDRSECDEQRQIWTMTEEHWNEGFVYSTGMNDIGVFTERQLESWISHVP